MEALTFDRRAVMGGLGAGVATSAVAAPAAETPATGQRWLMLSLDDIARAPEQAADIALRRGFTAVVVDGSGENPDWVVAALDVFAPAALRRGVATYAYLGELRPAPARAAETHDAHTAFARIGYARRVDPVAAALQDQVRGLLDLDDLAGLLLAETAVGSVPADLVEAYVAAPARLRGKSVSLLRSGAAATPALQADALFVAEAGGLSGAAVLRQRLA